MPNLLYLYLPICPDTYLICTDPLTHKANICKCYPSKFCKGYLSNICKFDHALTLAKFVPLKHLQMQHVFKMQMLLFANAITITFANAFTL
jgi:hypothetical protein